MNPSKDDTVDSAAPLLPYLLFSVGENIYGINSEFVHGIETLGDFTTVVDSEPNVRGGVFYQNEFIPLIDMRRLFGLETQIEEFEKAVNPEQRMKDHENWVAALEKSVIDRTEFKLTDDPHLCAFGKWYYSFKSDSNTLKYQLSAIEAPHKAVHETAKTVKQLMREQKYDLAMSAVNDMRATHYKTTLHILSSLRGIVLESLRELYIVIDSGDCKKGLIVDSIVGVENLERTLQLPDSMSTSRFVDFLGQRKKGGSVVLVLNNSI